MFYLAELTCGIHYYTEVGIKNVEFYASCQILLQSALKRFIKIYIYAIECSHESQVASMLM